MKRLLCLVLLGFLYVPFAAASPVVWTLNDISFQYPGETDSLVGSFTYDADTNTFSNVDLSFSFCCGSTSASIVTGSTDASILFHSYQPGEFELASPLTDAGGIVDAESGEYNYGTFILNPGGSLTGVAAAPEPEDAGLLAAGFGLLVLLGRRRRAA